MSTTEHLTVLVSIIVGLGISQLLSGAGKLMGVRGRVQPYAPTLATATLVFLAHVQFWWGNLGYGREVESNFFAFLFFLLGPILLYLMAAMVLPDSDIEGTISMRDHYFQMRPWFYSLGMLLPIASAVRNITVQDSPVWTGERPFEIGFAALMATGLAITRHGYHLFLSFTGVLLFLAMVIATNLRPG